MAASPATQRRLKYAQIAGWTFVLPALLIQAVFGWLPVGLAFVVAFQKYYLAKPPEWVGFANFGEVLADPLTPTCFINTFIYAGLSLGLTFIVPILVAIFLLEMRPRVVRVMMVLWFIPVAGMAGIVLWKWLYNSSYGALNAILNGVGLPSLAWLDSPNTAMISLVLPGVIMFGPGLVYIASLQSIPDELYEAADIEGAGVWQKIRYITLPRIRPIIAMMLIFGVIGALQIFELPFIMTAGGPGDATRMVVMRMYSLAFNSFRMDKATALSIVLFCAIMVLVIIQRRYIKEDIDV
jgi:multiple sugar transport system permease protein